MKPQNEEIIFVILNFPRLLRHEYRPKYKKNNNLDDFRQRNLAKHIEFVLNLFRL